MTPSIIDEIVYVMSVLQQLYPPKTFPRDAAPGTFTRGAWTRGGTSAGGQNLNDNRTAVSPIGQGNYFIGTKYLGADLGAPQRIVWARPEVNQERFGPPESAGWHVDASIVPGDPARETDTRAHRRIRTRLSPWLVDLWANDDDDMHELVQWFVAAIHVAMAGDTLLAGEEAITTGGYIPDEQGQRGVRYRLPVTFAIPIVTPYMVEVPMRGASIGETFSKGKQIAY